MKRFIDRSGGRILVDTLKNHGVDTAFCVAGESYLDVLNAFVDTPDINLITCRQEGGAAFMAEAYGKLTQKPGICLVTRGPGACNASIGVHTAMQDSSPMILFVGQVARDQFGREAFQEIDYRQMFAPPITKWAAQIDQTDRIPEMVARAFRIATSGRPGPVVLALPEDMLREITQVPDTPPMDIDMAWPNRGSIEKLNSLLEGSERPLAILGGSGWTEASCAIFENIAENLKLPVATAFRRQDSFNNKHNCYIGELGTGANPALVDRVRQSDLVITIGSRLSEMVTQGYTMLAPPVPPQTLVHIHNDPEEIGKVYTAELGIVSNTSTFCQMWQQRMPYVTETPPWLKWLEDAHQDYIDWTSITEREKFKLDVDNIIAELRPRLPQDAIITTDAGNFSCWAQRYLHYGRPGRLLAPTSGAMGYGLPAAIAASIAHPDRIVVGMAGDGGIMMNGQELATAVHAGAAPIMLIFNNGIFGTIRTHQEINYPGRLSATTLTNPDFAKWAESFGANGFAVSSNDEFAPAFEAALNDRSKPSVIECRMDVEQILPNKVLSEISGKPKKKKRK